MSEVVKYRSVQITVYPIARPDGREYWQFKRADGSQVTRSTLEKAKKAAKKEAQTIFSGSIDLEELDNDQIQAMKRLLAADPSCRLVDEFLVWHEKRVPKKMLGEARTEFLAMKEKNRGLSHYNVKNLKRHVMKLPDMNLGSFAMSDFPEIPGVNRTRRNVISAWVTFFKWCRKVGYLPFGEETVAEKLELPIAKRKIPETYSPETLKILLEKVTDAYFGWLACAAIAGIRTEETCPDPDSDKSPLDWSDFVWDRNLIIIRPETDKNGHRRVVPILPALRKLLWPIKKESGRVGPKLPPHEAPKGGKKAETSRLGEFIGGWKRNALRHSWISYRAAMVGIAKAAGEGGNSESEAKKSYNDAKGKDEAQQWFGVAFQISRLTSGEHPRKPL